MSTESGIVIRKRKVVKNTPVPSSKSTNDELKSKLKNIIDNDLDIIKELKKLDIIDLPTIVPNSRSELKELQSDSPSKSDKTREKPFVVHDKIDPIRSSNNSVF